jgi:hypothetical protein
MNFSDSFYENIITLALREREVNDIQSNVIESGFFGYEIIDSKEVDELIQQ